MVCGYVGCSRYKNRHSVVNSHFPLVSYSSIIILLLVCLVPFSAFEDLIFLTTFSCVFFILPSCFPNTTPNYVDFIPLFTRNRITSSKQNTPTLSNSSRSECGTTLVMVMFIGISSFLGFIFFSLSFSARLSHLLFPFSSQPRRQQRSNGGIAKC